jgi:hypothetical protein
LSICAGYLHIATRFFTHLLTESLTPKYESQSDRIRIRIRMNPVRSWIRIRIRLNPQKIRIYPALVELLNSKLEGVPSSGETSPQIGIRKFESFCEFCGRARRFESQSQGFESLLPDKKQPKLL